MCGGSFLGYLQTQVSGTCCCCEARMEAVLDAPRAMPVALCHQKRASRMKEIHSHVFAEHQAIVAPSNPDHKKC